jgi:soluble lytic murein transglycosylase-like protein
MADEMADRFGVNSELFRAIIHVESSWNPLSRRYEPEYKYLYFYRDCASKFEIDPLVEERNQKTSWGLCQVMGAVAREQGFIGHLETLCIAPKGLEAGARHLRRFVERYGEDNESNIIAAYNAGAARKDSSGMYRNQRYVDKVYIELRRLRQLS